MTQFKIEFVILDSANVAAESGSQSLVSIPAMLDLLLLVLLL